MNVDGVMGNTMGNVKMFGEICSGPDRSKATGDVRTTSRSTNKDNQESSSVFQPLWLLFTDVSLQEYG